MESQDRADSAAVALHRTGSDQTRLVLIRGNSGSGKSALAAAIRAARPRGVAILGHDHLRREILNVSDRPGALSVGYIDLSARFALDHGLHVVIEGILHEEIYGDMLRKLLGDHLGVSRCYRYDLSFEETLRRHATKGATALEFGEPEMRSWWRDHDRLTGVDEHLIGPATTLEEALEVVLTDCGWRSTARGDTTCRASYS